MSIKAKAIRTLYCSKRIAIDGVRQAVRNGLITEDEYVEITGNTY